MSENPGRQVTVVLTEGGRVPGYGFNPQRENAPCRVSIDVAITMVLTGKATYPDGGIDRLREIERGEFSLNQLSLFGKYTLAIKLIVKTLIETIQISIAFVFRNRIISISSAIAIIASLYSVGISQSWWPGFLKKAPPVSRLNQTSQGLSGSSHHGSYNGSRTH
jgi:hypothetical protein